MKSKPSVSSTISFFLRSSDVCVQVALDAKSASVGLGLIIQSASQLSEKIDDHELLVNKIEQLINNTKIFLK